MSPLKIDTDQDAEEELIMNLARRKVLTMVHDRRLSVDEAEELLDALSPTVAEAAPGLPKIGLVGESSHMQQFRKLLDRAAASRSAALIQGEPGTGKALCAKYIHHNSIRAPGSITGLDCSCSPVTAGSEIFGHEEGAFTGAVQPRRGLLDASEGGTLILDNIDALPPDSQGRLHGFLESGCFTRLGGTRQIHADVRAIGLVHGDLSDRVAAGTFREDLFRRLKVCLVQTAPIRERREDIKEVAEYHLRRLAERDDAPAPGLSETAWQLMQTYDWPRNESEISQAVESAFVLCDGDEITPDHLPELIGSQ